MIKIVGPKGSTNVYDVLQKSNETIIVIRVLLLSVTTFLWGLNWRNLLDEVVLRSILRLKIAA